MANTENLNLKLPEQTDFYNVKDFNENFQKVDDFSKRKDNPHGVTAEQVGSLKIYYSFEAINKELGKSFDYTTPIETIIQAMPDNTGLKADIMANDTTLYPAQFGTLTIYKIRENRVEIEYVSNVLHTEPEYNKRWVGQYNAGVFGGFKQVFTEQHPPTPEQVGAWKVDTDGMVTNITNLNDLYYSGFFRCTSAFTNTPVTPTGGDIVIVFPWDANTVLQIYSSSVDYTLWCRKSYFGGENIRLWKDWQKIALGEFLPIIGGTLTGYLGLKGGYGTVDADENHTNITAYPTKGDTSNRRGILIFNHKGEPTSGNAIQFRDVIDGVGEDYTIFGEHNKPLQSYKGLGNATERRIAVGGIGTIAYVYGGNSRAIVSPSGAIVTAGGQGAYGISGSYFRFENGELIIATTDTNVNGSGTTYYCQVL